MFIPKVEKKRAEGESGQIGLIASEFAFSKKNFFGEIYLSVQKEAAKHDMQLQIQSIDDEMKEQLILPPFIQNQSIDGLLILSHISRAYINAVVETGIPTVLIDHHDPHIKADCILTNNRFGAYEAVKHLIELGHRDIGFVGNVDFSPSYYERLDGFRNALHSYQIELNPKWIISNAPEVKEVVSDAIQQLDKKPTAWFCVNDGLGFLVLTALQQQGYRVPDDVSVCSFDNGELSRLSTPMITTMDIDLHLYGRKAVEQLQWRRNNPDDPMIEMLLPVNLINRDSTAMVPTATLTSTK